ncbi:MAG TPA: PQQ-binding-like beta-propeller repeat protein [Solirubrobacterales bacterium]|nr:PQQ-binding-like beta-propeller repeat protein [Solirubrobacterales bacterium]
MRGSGFLEKHLWHRSNRWLAVALLALGILVSGAIVGYELLKRPGDVHNEEAIRHFKPQKPPPPKEPQTVNWPVYGQNPARTKYLPVKGIKPPFDKRWRFTDRPLLEFPPIYVGGKLYFVNNSGFAYALDADTGKTLWKRRIGRLNASSPAYFNHRLYIVNLVPGHIVKLDAKTGRLIWKRDLPGRAESSPVVIDRTVYFGCENGELFAMSTGKGQVRWSTTLGGPIKSAPAYYGGRLYVGDYGGHMNAVDAKTGKLVWQSGSLGPGYGGSGAFYSTPAVAYGRVYAGNNDARVYSYDISDGTLAWSYSTGGYAYSGPAVANTKHSPPTVFIGSFDGNVYALNAKDGSVRWSRSAGGQVVGSLSAVGDIVYVAEFTNKTTSGFMMRSGKRVFRYPKGTYTPVISDGRRIYLTGYSSITALQPHRAVVAVASAHPARKPGKAQNAAAPAGRSSSNRSSGSGSCSNHRSPGNKRASGNGGGCSPKQKACGQKSGPHLQQPTRQARKACRKNGGKGQ